MNELIQQIFENFEVDGEIIPVKYLYYYGHGEPYVVYMRTDSDEALGADDDVINYVDYYDFDVYSTGNYTHIVESIKAKLKEHGFVWSPSRTGPDLFETETKYYHITLSFAVPREG